MPTEGDPSVVLDNTVVSNFAVVGRMDILRERYGGRLLLTREVLIEAEEGPRPASIRRAIEEGWLELQPLYADSEEYLIFVELRERGFGLGEASAIALCSTVGPRILASDDLDARNEARRRSIGVVGTYGILARQVAEGHMSLKEGNELLRRMIHAGFRSHSSYLREEVERLKSR